MARCNFRDAVFIANEEGNVQTISGVEVSVYQAGTLTPAPIYGSRSLGDVAPLTQPLTTDTNGVVDFWAPAGDYDIFFHDTVGTPRIDDQTVGWSSLSGADGGVPGAKVATDAGLALGSLSAVSMRQFVPIGSVIDWWRPSSSWDAGAGAGNAPPGFAICNGQVITEGNHDFGSGSITLPDLRNKFIIGADILKTDTAASTNGDGTAAYNSQHPNAPGIRGVGGSNITHSHSVPAHKHGKGDLAIASSGGHTTTATQANHTHALGQGNLHDANNPVSSTYYWASGTQLFDGPYEMLLYRNGTNTETVNGGPPAITVSGDGKHTHGSVDFSGSVGATGGVSGDASMTSGTVDGRPQHYGLLKIMKVKRN